MCKHCTTLFDKHHQATIIILKHNIPSPGFHRISSYQCCCYIYYDSITDTLQIYRESKSGIISRILSVF